VPKRQNTNAEERAHPSTLYRNRGYDWIYDDERDVEYVYVTGNCITVDGIHSFRAVDFHTRTLFQFLEDSARPPSQPCHQNPDFLLYPGVDHPNLYPDWAESFE
jgi:hypothetical protein